MNGTTRLEQAGAEFRQAARDASLIALTRMYPDWSIQQNGDSEWSAIRLSDGGPTIEAPDLNGLAAKIAEQDTATQPNVPWTTSKITTPPTSPSNRDER